MKMTTLAIEMNHFGLAGNQRGMKSDVEGLHLAPALPARPTSRTGHRPALRDGRFVESPDAFSARIGTMNSGRAVAPRESVLECGSPYVFSVFAGRANGARTLVRRKIGRRRSLEISKRGSALPAFLRDKSRAPGEFLVGALNRRSEERAQQRTPATRVGAVLRARPLRMLLRPRRPHSG